VAVCIVCCFVQFELLGRVYRRGVRIPLTVQPSPYTSASSGVAETACAAMLRWPRLRVLMPQDWGTTWTLARVLAEQADRMHRSHRVNWMAAAVALAAVRVDQLIGLSVVPLLTGICAMAAGPADDPFRSGAADSALGPAPVPVRPVLRISPFIGSRFARAELVAVRPPLPGSFVGPDNDFADAAADGCAEPREWAACRAHSERAGDMSVIWEGVYRRGESQRPIMLANRFGVLIGARH
jgi:hypothetical protein